MAERLTYTVQEAAQALGVGRNSAYALLQRGELPCVRVGRRVLIPRDAILRLLGIGPADQEQAATQTSTRHEPESEAVYIVTVRRVPGDTLPTEVLGPPTLPLTPTG
jgi:excisionase family DNA binding protein